MTTVNFISVRGQQNFEDEVVINLIEIKIENDKTKNIFEKYKENPVKFSLKELLFSSAIKNKTEKIFLTVVGLMDAKYSLINGKLHQTIDVLNLNEIGNWNEIKKSSRWLYVEL